LRTKSHGEGQLYLYFLNHVGGEFSVDEVSDRFHDPDPQYPLHKRLGGPHRGSGRRVEDENLLHLPRIGLRPFSLWVTVCDMVKVARTNSVDHSIDKLRINQLLTKLPSFMDVSLPCGASLKHFFGTCSQSSEYGPHPHTVFYNIILPSTPTPPSGRLLLILSRDRVTLDGVWIANWIYGILTLVTTNTYDNLAELHCLKITVNTGHTKSS
jgi:hypothetical protein